LNKALVANGFFDVYFKLTFIFNIVFASAIFSDDLAVILSMLCTDLYIPEL